MQDAFRHNQWYKGSVHIHSTVSDGAKSYDEAVEWYAGNGFDFVAMTDHNVFGQEHNRNGFLILSGIEMAAHTVGLGMSQWREPGVELTQQQEIDHINQCGGISIVAHPYWHGLTLEHLGALRDYSAIEVYNTHCDATIGRGYASVHWDYLLAAGRRIYGYAVDDSHWRGESEGGGYIVVNAASLSASSLLQELQAGSFYATQGPGFYQIRHEANTITVETTPVQRVNFMANPPKGKVVQTQGLLETAHFELPDGIDYVRVELMDERGRMAWSNPVWL